MGDGDEMEREREWRGRGSRVVAVTMAGGWQTCSSVSGHQSMWMWRINILMIARKICRLSVCPSVWAHAVGRWGVRVLRSGRRVMY